MSKASRVSSCLVFSDEKQECVSRFMATRAAVKTFGEVRNVYKKYVPYLNVHKRIIASLCIASGIMIES